MYLFLCTDDLRWRGLTRLDHAALFFAAMCHDCEHPGLTNSFLINTNSPLAVRCVPSNAPEPPPYLFQCNIKSRMCTQV